MPYLILPALSYDQRGRSGRGYTQGRFRGTNLVYSEAEYRFPISACGGIIGGVVFANLTTASNTDKHDRITHLKRVAEIPQRLKLRNSSLDLIVYPGHQMKSIDNNVYLVTTPEGIALAHLGDQINEGDFMIDYDWIDKVGLNHRVDVLMPNACTPIK